MFINKKFGNDVADYVKVTKVIVAISILFGFDINHTIQKWVWALVENEELWESFPWCSYSYQILLHYLTHLPTHHKQGRHKRNSYHFYGFSLAFMAWIYCVIPQLGKVCGGIVSMSKTPRILQF